MSSVVPRLRLMSNALLVVLALGLALSGQIARAQVVQPYSALQSSIDAVLSGYPEATVAVAVRDPATGTVLDLHAERSFHAASTMKVPVMIEVFAQAEHGRFALDDSLTIRNSFRSIVDGSAFSISDDSDTAIYEHLGDPMSVRDLTERMITQSSNLATNLVIEHVTPDSVRHTVARLGAAGMRVLRGVEDIKAYRQGLSNTTTAPALATLLLALLEERTVSPTADSSMVDILLDQRHNTMIPAGLPEGTRVAHKTGWITRIHHDAAIVFPERTPPYVLVILTEGVEEHTRSSRLGAEIARVVHTALRGD